VINDGDGTLTVQIVNASKNSRYYVQVGAKGDGQSGDYQLDADIRTQAVNLQSLAEGTLPADSAVDYRTLTTGRSQVMYFELTAAGLPDDVTGGIRMAIFDSAGHVVTTLFALAGQTVSASTFLAAGKYTIRFEALTPDGFKLPTMTYGLKGVTLTDPIATASSDPTLSPLSPDYTLSRGTVKAYAGALDILGDVIW
jgi:hypothetical protein